MLQPVSRSKIAQLSPLSARPQPDTTDQAGDHVELGQTSQPEQPDLRTLLSARKFSMVQSSPDGQRLAFYQGGLKLQDPDGKERVLFPGPVKSYQWVDENTLVFAYDRQGNERWNLALVKADGTPFRSEDGSERPYMKVTDSPDAVHHILFQAPGKLFYRSNERNGKDYDLFCYDLQNQEHELLHLGKGNVEPLSQLPDGRLLTSQLHSNANNDLVAIDLKSGEEQLLTPHVGNAVFQPDSLLSENELLCITNKDREMMTPAVLDLKSGEVRYLFETRWDVEQMSYHADSKQLACVFNEDGYSRLRIYDVERQEWVARPTLPDGVVGQLEWTDAKRVRFSMNCPDKPNSYGELDLEDGSLRWLKEASFPRPLDPNGFVKPETVHYTSFDGTVIPALLYRAPQAPGSPSAGPVVINLHGGPEAQSRPRFDAVVQHLVDRGISVLNPNIRGSTGYGRTYLDADNVEKRPDAIQDVKASSQFLKSIGFDAARIGLLGGSYGGYMVQAAMAFAPEENWAAGVSSVGMSNLETFMQNTAAWRQGNRAAEYGDPVKDAATLKRWSPVNYAHNIEGPLMIVQGANDPRVPQSEADQMVAALREQGEQVEYILLKDEGHSISNPDNAIRVYTRASDFLAEKLTAPR